MARKAIVATTIAVAAITAATALPASANIGGNDPRDCTRTEFRAIDRGMKIERVQRIVESRGTIDSIYSIGGHRYVNKTYGKGYRNGWCLIGYRDGRVRDRTYLA